MKKVIIIGGTSGIGEELAAAYIHQGDSVGITGRRQERLDALKEKYTGAELHTKRMDVQTKDCTLLFDELILEMGGMDVCILSAGVGKQNPELDPGIELETVQTNVLGFTQMAIHAFLYFKKQNKNGQLVGISSIAATKALRQAPSYSASKNYEAHYLSCLAQKANKERLPIRITTIKPGFIRTALVKQDYPLMIDVKSGASLIFRAIEKKKRNAIVPFRWVPITFLWKMIPSFIWERC